MAPKTRKVYIQSRELRGVISCVNIVDGCVSLLKQFGANKTIDSTWFCVDERGYREPHEAMWTVPVTQVLKAAGFVFEGNEEQEYE